MSLEASQTDIQTDGAGPDLLRVETTVSRATRALLDLQQDDGHWVFELEADATIPAEYVLLVHYLGEEPDLELERKIGVYLRRIQGVHGGWPLFTDGAFDISATVKAYFALKMIGDDIEAPHMVRAREAILAHGGASQANVFTRLLLCLFGEMPWRGVPVMPVEIMLLPRWFPFHLSKVSYWARTVIAPLVVLQALKPKARNPRDIHVRELFVTDPDVETDWAGAPNQHWFWGPFFNRLDDVLKLAEPRFPKGLRKRAIDKAVAFVTERLNGEDGLGAIFPAMANSVMMFDVLGYPKDHPDAAIARQSIDKLLLVTDEEAYCQPCLSPVWDTALACHALMEAGDAEAEDKARAGLDWLKDRQVLDTVGDWAEWKPDVRPGGWAFQYNNDHYPDLDDTAVVVMAMDRALRPAGMEPAMAGAGTGGSARYDEAISRGREFVEGLQSRNGGWGAFDADNTYYFLNNIPFSDHGALLDPPTADVTARCVGMLAQLGEKADAGQMKAAIDYLEKEQEEDGSWYGRWGVNYVYGTWSVLNALNAAGLDPDHPMMVRAADWLISIQNEDGGWGEDCDSYKLDYRGFEPAPSTASQTAWALLGLMAAGRVDHPSVERGIAWLMATQGEDGLWPEERFSGTGFPRVFYLRYHGYRKFFPLWAAARYRNLKKSNTGKVAYGM